MWDEQTGRALGRGAAILNSLRRLEPGQVYRVTGQSLQDIIVPANPLDRQSAEYLVEWMRVRLPFFAVVRSEPISRFWDFYRPMPEEVERLMQQEGERGGN